MVNVEVDDDFAADIESDDDWECIKLIFHGLCTDKLFIKYY